MKKKINNFQTGKIKNDMTAKTHTRSSDGFISRRPKTEIIEFVTEYAILGHHQDL
jgi:hypothetical protein